MARSGLFRSAPTGVHDSSRLLRRISRFYLYLLIEFQSESDGWMAVRTQVYQGLLVTVSGDALEIKTMKSNIPRNIDLWVGHLLAKGKAEGLAEGRAKGEAKGLVKGKAEALVCLLAERFGAVAPSLRERIRRAKLPTLERWFKRAIVARDLPSVFNPRVQIK